MNKVDLIEKLIPCILQAGIKIMEIYDLVPKKTFKPDGSPVTEADKAAEKIILADLKRIVPDIPIVSEENPDSHSNTSTDKYFLVDPLDGTKEFLKQDGKGSFTVNIGLIENKIPVMGIIYAPALNRLFCGCNEYGAWEVLNNTRKQLSVRIPESHNIIAVASISHKDQETADWLTKRNINNTISVGSSLKFCLVASGEADVYPRFGPTMEWDTAAGDAILRAAGGLVTNPDLSNLIYGKPHYKNNHFIAWGGYKE
jgi:3'(2'), 5'-bisphosphate nucleotidase